MSSDPQSMDEPLTRPDGSKRLSPNGQMIAIGVYGSLVLVGFFFGIVTGYDRPKPNAVAKAPREKDKDQPKAEAPRPPAPAPKANPESKPEPPDEPKEEPRKVDPPKV